uniref:Uncharacterized protein n=1 Tax=Theileria annulata TaxID=5874 RepID=A0A3B0MP74_THEAN
MGFGDTPLKTSAFILAGLAMMLNIRLSYSSAPYALIRFKLHENLFSVFVRRMSSALELWCLPSMVVGNIMEQVMKRANLQSEKKNIITWPSIVTMWLNFLTFVILLFVYRAGGEQGRLTTFYWTIAASGFVFGINMVLVYAQDDYGTITYYMIGENSFPALTSLIHYITTLIFGNRRKYNSDFLIVTIDIIVAIIISFVAAAVWTAEGKQYNAPGGGSSDETHAESCGYNINRLHNISPVLMVLVGMGLVYMIYPAIAPGMIVPFYLIDKIEMILLIATAVPPVIVATLKKNNLGPFVYLGNWGGKHGDGGSGCTIGGETKTWQPHTGMPAWHLCDVFVIIMISLAYIFIYSLHYKDSGISRAIINQPKMSTFLSTLFYMSHEISLAVGFPGIASDAEVLLPTQLIGAFLMVLLAPYSEGYIIEYKSHDPAFWPTEGMTPWNAFCYWLKMASR